MTGETTRMKISFSGQLAAHLMWLMALVLQFASLTECQYVYTVYPKNLTVEAGKSVTFECGVKGLSSWEKVHFTIMSPKVNSTVECPGQQTTYLPAQSMRAHCESRSTGDIAVWDIAGTSQDDNNTIFLCHVNNKDEKYGSLYVYENAGYYARLIGYAIGGFFAAIITIVVVYILLKRSERAQQCFRSVGGLNDVQST